ncbi:MAG: PilZ domain-containing protein [Gammaproteobacteria bacterium]|nr:PilZ domain-containing protein [Gammaproteobacteria bacterium]MDH3468795.1 PilZ domain-containing protein [Gammaproteobacteria bacterium]
MNVSDGIRRYSRYPTDIPVMLGRVGGDDDTTCRTRNLSQGGMSFEALSHMEPGTSVHLRVPVCRPPIEVDSEVVWCRAASGVFETGVRFEDAASLSGAWMAEQVKSIETYRFQKLHNDGRALDGDQALREWLAIRPNLTPPASP